MLPISYLTPVFIREPGSVGGTCRVNLKIDKNCFRKKKKKS